MEIPGYADLQVNGYKGVDFSSQDLTSDKIRFVCRELKSQKIIAFLPTVVTSIMEVYEHNLPLLAEAMDKQEIGNLIPGIHLEGPFLSDSEARGVHNPDWMLPLEVDYFNRLFELAEGKIKMLTISAELSGAESFCDYVSGLGVTVSLGHQMATETEIDHLSETGAVSLTHLGNGLPFLIQRHHNPLFAGMANDRLTAMIITDGFHLPPSVIKTIIRAKGIGKVVIVSDSSPVAGLAPGNYKVFGDNVVLEESGFLYNPKTGYLAGSSYTIKQCMEYLASLNLLSEQELLEVGFYNPLKLIKVDPVIFF
jgi:N-acetylglucosamine-6-phosphate deacetylase